MAINGKRGISILGSTGSIGNSTLNVIDQHTDRFEVVAMAGGRNVEEMIRQVKKFRPEIVSMSTPEGARVLKEGIGNTNGIEILYGEEGLNRVASAPDAEIVVSSLVGSVGLLPTLTAIREGKDIALANKETLVMAGRLVMEEARKADVSILPVDSEHSAIFQSLEGHRKEDLNRIILTASGGAFLNLPLEKLPYVTPKDALKHPNWDMGAKVTVDSASLMNKALEVIEARWLFNVPPSKIQVRIHPQSIIHSMVEYIDGSVIAQMGIPDMKVPISYALAYPERIHVGLPFLDLVSSGPLTFIEPRSERFPALGLAFDALEAGGCMPAVLNGANEVAVEAFLEGKIRFTQIIDVVKTVMDSRIGEEKGEDLETILHADKLAREHALSAIREL